VFHLPADVIFRPRHWIDRPVCFHSVPLRPAKQLMDGPPLHLPGDVPERNIDAADRVHHEAPPPHIAGRFVHQIPEFPWIAWIAPEEQFAKSASFAMGWAGVND